MSAALNAAYQDSVARGATLLGEPFYMSPTANYLALCESTSAVPATPIKDQHHFFPQFFLPLASLQADQA
jgi:hypothetical protein